jgi:hypothetical protein
MVDLAIPAVNFYSMLSGLGDTLQANRAAQMKRDAFASATTPGPDGKIDYSKAILGLAQVDPQAASVLAADRNHQDTIHQQAIETARNAANDAFNHTYQNATLALAKRAADRADDPTPTGFVRGNDNTLTPLTGGPADPAYIASKAKAEADAAVGKPIPFETLSGTKFLVRQPNGSYAQVDPNAVGAPPSPAPQPPVTPVGSPPISAPVNPGNPSSAAPTTPVASPPVAPNAPIVPAAAAPVAAPQLPPQADLNAVDPTTGRRENWLKAQSPDVQAYIKKVADYEIDPRTTSTKGGHREQVMSAVAQYDPTYDQNTFGSRAKAIKDFSTGQQGNAIRSFDVATDHLDTLQKYVAAMKNGDIPLLNKIRNAWQQETGSSLPTNVQAVAPIVGAEVSKAIIGSNNALADREELRQPLQNSRSPEQLAGAIEAYKSLMTGQLNGLKKQYEDTTGKKNFADRLRPNTKAVLMGGEGGSSKVTSQPNVTSTGIKWSVQ